VVGQGPRRARAKGGKRGKKKEMGDLAQKKKKSQEITAEQTLVKKRQRKGQPVGDEKRRNRGVETSGGAIPEWVGNVEPG